MKLPAYEVTFNFDAFGHNSPTVVGFNPGRPGRSFELHPAKPVSTRVAQKIKKGSAPFPLKTESEEVDLGEIPIGKKPLPLKAKKGWI